MINKNSHIKITCNEAFTQNIIRVLNEADQTEMESIKNAIEQGSVYPYDNGDEFDLLRDIYINVGNYSLADKKRLLANLKTYINNDETCLPTEVAIKEFKLIDTETIYVLMSINPSTEEITEIAKSKNCALLLSKVPIILENQTEHCEIRAFIYDLSESKYVYSSLGKRSIFNTTMYEAISHKHPFLVSNE